MIRKSGYRFFEKRSCSNKKIERADDSKESRPALGRNLCARQSFSLHADEPILAVSMFAGCSRHGERASPADADDAVSADRAARAAALNRLRADKAGAAARYRGARGLDAGGLNDRDRKSVVRERGES